MTAEIEVEEGSDIALALELARYGLTDAGNSRRFSRRFHGRLIHVRGPGWHRWTGQVWTAVPDEDLLREAKLVAKKLWEEVGLTDDADKQRRIAEWAHRTAMRPRLEAMVKLAAAGEIRGDDLKINVSQLDRNRDILNTPTGIVDLPTGALLDHEAHKTEYCTRMTHVGYDPHADPAGWEAFLKRFWPDPKVREALQDLAGASITGYPLKAIACLLGPDGDNGKTTLAEALKAALGAYGATAQESTFTNASAREAQYDLAELRGVRYVVFSETRAGHGLAAERIKRVTGGDRIGARRPYGKPFEYAPAFTLWLPTNHAPRVPAGEKAMWKRIWAVHCDVTIPKREQIQDYADVLVRDHGPGILRWAAEGAQRFYARGKRLPLQPKPIREYAARWRDRDDVVKRWISERTEPDPSLKVSFRDTFVNFRDWCEESGESEALRDYTSQRFHDEMDQHYPRSDKKSMGYYQRLGIRLIS